MPKFGVVPPEVPNLSTLTGLAPRFREKVERVCQRMKEKGWPTQIFETLRTDARQAFLYGFGRDYDDGRGVVTHSKTALDTWHRYGLAVDIIHPVYRWNAPKHYWRDLELCAEAEGLVSGQDWDSNDATKETFVDSPHIQWGKPMRRSPSPSAAAILATHGTEAVWREVGCV